MDGTSQSVEADASGGLGRSISQSVSDLKQRQTFRVAVAYAVAAWLIVQVVATVAPAFDLPDWVLRAVILLAVAGFALTIGYFLLFREPVERGGWLGSSKLYPRVVAAGLLLTVLVTAATWVVRGGMLFGTGRVSLAVLPFADISPDRDKAYFAEGVAEEILSTLAAEEGIKVLGRTSARQIEQNPEPAEVRSSLGVTHLLEGSTRTAGDQLRVNVRLIDTRDGSQLWEEEYQGRLADIFSVQDRIATSVVKRLRGTFSSSSLRQTRPTGIDNYQTYLAARALMRSRSEKTLKQALGLAKKVVEADPNYAPGRAMLAELYMHLSYDAWAYGRIPILEARRLGLPHAQAAIRLAPDKPDGYAALGLWLRDERGIAPLRKAIELDPARAEVRIWLGILFNYIGRNDEAFEQYRAALDIEPLWPVAMNRVVQVFATSGKIDEAKATIDQYRRRGGAQAQTLRFMAHIKRTEGDMSESIRLSRAALKQDPTLPYARGWIVQQGLLVGLPEVALTNPEAVLGPYQRMLIDGDPSAVAGLIRRDGARFWGRRDTDAAFWLLGRQRDWSTMIELYDRRPRQLSDFCRRYSYTVTAMIIALRQTGRAGEADKLLQCARRLLATEMANRWKSPDHYSGELEARQAAIFAVTGDRRAMDWLAKAIAAGWRGQYYSGQLKDWPEFDLLGRDQRLAKLQRRVDAGIARERAEVLALYRDP